MTKTTENPFANVQLAPVQLEQVEDGITFEYRKGYHLDAQRNAQIPVIFRRPDGFYHWHDDSAIVGFFILSRTDKVMKAHALAVLLMTHPDECHQFGLTREQMLSMI